MRPYPHNSSEAVARIVALTLVADGRLDATEFAMLHKTDAFARMGLSEARFVRILREFCQDLLDGDAGAAGDRQLVGEEIRDLLEELDDPRRQQLVLRLMLDVIRADGKLHADESRLFWQAIEQWKLRLTDIVRSVPQGFRRFPPAPRNPKRKIPRPQPQPPGLRLSGT